MGGKIGYGLSAITSTGGSVFTKVISYTPFGCLGIGTEVEDSIEEHELEEVPVEEKKLDDTIDQSSSIKSTT